MADVVTIVLLDRTTINQNVCVRIIGFWEKMERHVAQQKMLNVC